MLQRYNIISNCKHITINILNITPFYPNIKTHA